MTAPADSPHPTHNPPPAAGVRLGWDDLPEPIRSGIARRLGGAVTAVRSQPGGFSPGLAALIETGAGDRAFVKAAGPFPNPTSAAFHRREATVAAALPLDAPTSRLRWSWDTGPDGWVVLAFDALDGRSPATPWLPDELELVLGGLARLSASLTPSPVPVAVVGSVADWGGLAGGWWRRAESFQPEGLDAWSVRHAATLAVLERAAPSAGMGETLLHLDLRADNMLLTADGVRFIDWPHARLGAAWVDLAFLAPSVAMQGGPEPDALMARLIGARRPDDAALVAVVAAIAGFFTLQAVAPPPPGLPTLRAFQADQGAVARAWLARLTGLE